MKYLLLLLLFCFYLLPCFAQEPKLVLPEGNSPAIVSIEFSPDGKYILSLSLVGTPKLWEVSSGKLIFSLEGHSSIMITSASFSPDQKYIVTTAMDNIVKIWQTSSGKLLTSFEGHSNSVALARFSQDGKFLVTGSCDNSVKVWDVSSWKLLLTLKGHKECVTSVFFSRNGNLLLTISDDRTAILWDLISGKRLYTLTGHKAFLTSAIFSLDEKYILTTSADGITKMWNTENGQLLYDLVEKEANTNAQNFLLLGSFPDASFSPDQKYILTCSRGTVILWDKFNGKQVRIFGQHNKSLSAIFSPDGEYIITISVDSTVNIWEIQTGNLLQSFKDPTQFSNLAISGTKLFAVSDDPPKIKFWDFELHGLPRYLKTFDLKGNVEPVNASFSSDENSILIIGDSSIKSLDLKTGKLTSKLNNKKFDYLALNDDNSRVGTLSNDTVQTWKLNSNSIENNFFISLKDSASKASLSNSIKFSNVGKYLVIDSFSYKGPFKMIAGLQIWDVIQKKKLYTLDNASGFDFSFDDSLLVASTDSNLLIMEAPTGKRLNVLKAQGFFSEILISPNKQYIAASLDVASQNSVDVWNIKDQHPLYTIADNNLVGFSLDGKYLFTDNNDTIEIRNVETGKQILQLIGHKSEITDVEYSSDKRYIASASNDHTAKIWDSKTGQLLVDLLGHKDIVNSVKFNSNGNYVLTVSADHTAKLWNALNGRLIFSLVLLNNNNYLVIDSLGRYDGTEEARELLYFTCGTEVIGLDQVKDQLWIPDLAERIMKGETINAPKLSDLNICGLTPEVEDEEAANGYQFKITPRKGGLGETVLYVNDIEVKRYQPSELHKISTGYELDVSKQSLQSYFVADKENDVTVKAFTAENDISSRGVQVKQKDTVKQVVHPDLYAVMVGVSDYKGNALDLKYAAKDANDLSNAVAAAAKKLLGKEHVFMYNINTGENRSAFPEKKAIEQAFEDIGKKATANDILLIFFAGHGTMANEENKKQFYFLTAEASTFSTDNFKDVGISTAELTEWIKPQNIKAQKRILIFDACNSGQAINDLIKIGDSSQNYIAARSDDNPQQIKAIDKLNERSGMNILCASASNQNAYEMGRYSQGLLTYSLLKAIKEQPDILEDGKYLNVDKWFVTAKKNVEDIINQNGNRQQPQKFGTGDFYVGEVDNDVISKIILPKEKALFTASSFNNKDESVGGDDLDLSNLLNRQLQDISSRGTESNIDFIPNSNAPDAYSLKGSYEVKSDSIIVSVNIWQNKKNTYRYQVKGDKKKMDELISEIVKEAEEWVNGKK